MAYDEINNTWDGTGKKCEFICDTDDDVANLPKCCCGSTAISVASGKIFFVNASGEWVEFGAGA